MNAKVAITAACLLLVGASDMTLADNACMEGPMAEFGRYIGDWKIEDQGLSQDGSEWTPGDGARWTFECIGDGVAVQDYWRPNSGGFGTNLRTYNPATGAWEIAWASTGLNGLMHIAAVTDADGNVVMDVLKPVTDHKRRIIFFAPDDAGWSWVQQWSYDNGATWLDVYRIRATPYASE